MINHEVYFLFFGLKSIELIIHGDWTKAGLMWEARYIKNVTRWLLILAPPAAPLRPLPDETCFPADPFFRAINS